MNRRFKSLCLFLALFAGVFFIAPHTGAAAPEAEAKVAWLAEQIADYLQIVTGDTFGESFRDMIADILNRERTEDAPWYQALNQAHQGCEAAGLEPASTELQERCEVDKRLAIQAALEVLPGSAGLPPSLYNVIDRALGQISAELGPEREPEVIDPGTSEQDHYYEEGREVSPSQ